jgi:hypothetical protein
MGSGVMSGPDGRGSTVSLRYGPDVSTARGYGFKIQQDFTTTSLVSSQTTKDPQGADRDLDRVYRRRPGPRRRG